MPGGGCTGPPRGKTRSYKVTHDVDVDIPAAEAKLRAAIQWQKGVVELLCGYVDTIAHAFEELVQIHQLLNDKNFSQVDLAGPMSASLLIGLREAAAGVNAMVEASRSPLERHRGTLEACLEDITQADDAEAERRHYSEKVVVLTNSEKTPKALAKLERNREKLNQAEAMANASQVRSQESVRAMGAKREQLCALATDVLSGTVAALRASVAKLEPPQAPEAPLQKAYSLSKGELPIPVQGAFVDQAELSDRRGTVTAGPNPFSEDIGHCRRLDLPPPQRLEGASRSDPRATIAPSMATVTLSKGPAPGSVLEEMPARRYSWCARLMPCSKLG
jgi:hypothetical protein